MTMRTFLLISFGLLLALPMPAATNYVYVSEIAMPTASPGASDYLFYYKYSGVKYQYTKDGFPDFCAQVFASSAGQSVTSSVANLTATVATNATNAATALVNTSNALSATIAANAATAAAHRKRPSQCTHSIASNSSAVSRTRWFFF